MLPREVLKVKEIGKLLDAFPDTWTGHRNKTLFTIQYRCVLRISEALSLIPADYDEEEGTLRVRRGKGGRPRIVHVPEDARQALTDWLRERGDKGARTPIFCSRSGKKLDKCNINKTLKATADYAGIYKRVHTHQMRYSGASNMFRNGVRLDLIQGQLGHRKVSTTSIYLLELDPSERIKELETIKW